MTDDLRERIARAMLRHHGDQIHDGLVRCVCGERFDNYSGPNGHALHLADAVLAELGLEQVGWLVDMGTRLTAQPRSTESGVPVYIVREDTDE